MLLVGATLSRCVEVQDPIGSYFRSLDRLTVLDAGACQLLIIIRGHFPLRAHKLPSLRVLRLSPTQLLYLFQLGLNLLLKQPPLYSYLFFQGHL